MKKTFAAVLLPLGALMVFAAPAQADTPAATISNLQSQGYTVTINRIGNGAMSECTVVGVRTTKPANQFSLINDDDTNVFTTAQRPKATVSLNCAG